MEALTIKLNGVMLVIHRQENIGIDYESEQTLTETLFRIVKFGIERQTLAEFVIPSKRMVERIKKEFDLEKIAVADSPDFLVRHAEKGTTILIKPKGDWIELPLGEEETFTGQCFFVTVKVENGTIVTMVA